MRDVGRAFNKLKCWVCQSQLNKIKNFRIFSPIVLPYYQIKFARKINCLILSNNIKRLLKIYKTPPILWLSIPTPVDLVGKLDEKLSIYYCGDEFSEFPGIHKRAIIEMEKELLSKVDVVIVSSEKLYQSKSRFNKHTYLVRHGVNFEHFQKAKLHFDVIPKDVEEIKHPIVGYCGYIAEWVDLELIKFLASARPHYSFILIGGQSVDLTLLKKLNNVYLIGPKSYEELPYYVRTFDTAIIPFKRNKLTKYVNPLKLLEYFAAEKPVVATSLPSYERFKAAMKTAKTKEDFLKHIDEIIKDCPIGMVKQAQEIARNETWQRKVETIDGIIKERLANK